MMFYSFYLQRQREQNINNSGFWVVELWGLDTSLLLSVCLLVNLEVTLTSVCGQVQTLLIRQVCLLNCVCLLALFVCLFVYILKIQKGKIPQSMEYPLQAHSSPLESRVQAPQGSAGRHSSGLTAWGLKEKVCLALGPATDRHLRSSGCPAVEAPALSVQRALQPPFNPGTTTCMAQGSDDRVQYTNRTPGKPVTSPTTNQSAWAA